MKRIAKICLIFLLAVFTGAGVFGQTSISGNVSTKEGALPGVNIFIEGSYDGTSTNANGEFRFVTTKTGKVKFRAEFMGYEPFAKEIELNGSALKFDIQLVEAFNKLDAVTITAGTFEAGDKKQAVILSSLDMVTTAGANGDVYGALQSLPGTTTNGESGKLFVKGGDSDESQTFIDGSLVYAPYNSSAPNISTRGRFNPFMFKGTIFSTGGYSAEYGQALSSVLLLNTNDMPAQDQLDISVLSVGAELAGTKLWKSGAVTATVSYNNLEPYMRIAPQNYSWVHSPEYGSGALSVRQKTGKTGMFKLYGSFGGSKYILSVEDLNSENKFIDYNLQNTNSFLNASWRSSLGKGWLVATAASYTNNSDKVKFEGSAFEKQLIGTHLKSVFTNQITEKFTLKFGGELFAKDYHEDFYSVADTFLNSYQNTIVSGFAEAELYASKKFVFRLGSRLEYGNYLDRTTLSPRISAAYKINSFSQFSAAYGWFYQDPTADYLLYTNRLDYERANHYTLSYQLSENNRTFRAEIYYKDYNNLVKFNGDEFYLPENYSNAGDGYARGLDIFWRDKKTIKYGDYWVSYSYLDTKRDYKNFPVEAIPSFASKHNFAVVYKHWFGGLRSLAGVNMKYSSPRVYNNPNSSVFNGEKMLPYRSLDISWSFLYRQNVIFYGAITNVLGFKQEYGNNYATIPDENGVYRSAPIVAGSDRFFVVACFITLTQRGEENQLDKIE